MSSPEVERDFEEIISDRVLLLYLATALRKKGLLLSGDLKLQKLTYKSEENMIRNQFKGFNYFFRRYKMGPWSVDLSIDAADLVKTGFLNKPGNAYLPSRKCIRLIDDLEEIFEINRDIIDVVDQVIREFGEYRGKDLKVLFYAYPRPGERIPVRDVALNEPLLNKLENANAVKRFFIPPECIETIAIITDPETRNSIERAFQDLKEGKESVYIPIS